MASADVRDGQISANEKRKLADKSTTEKPRKKMANGWDMTRGSAGEALEFNLSDPELLAQQLERVDITEEESDELLREAYKINKRLKMMLKQKQDKVAASLRSRSASSQIDWSNLLPPIHAKGGSGVPQRSMKAYGQNGSKTAGGGAAAGKSKTAKTRSPSHKPQWDDRFSFS